MKQTNILIVAFAAVLSVGVVSCSTGKSNDNHGGGDETPAGWVDLGLPSGLLWAECNLGANSPEEYGNYYAWSETTIKRNYNWSTYRYCIIDGMGDLQMLTKYNTSRGYGEVDNLMTLNATDDAATVTLGGSARIPTKAEWEELMNNTTTEWTSVNGVYGRKFTATNGNSLFLPASGHYIGSDLLFINYFGIYWSSSLRTDNPCRAWGFGFNSNDHSMGDGDRFTGVSVRPVCQN